MAIKINANELKKLLQVTPDALKTTRSASLL